jgi:hypothetical protein
VRSWSSAAQIRGSKDPGIRRRFSQAHADNNIYAAMGQKQFFASGLEISSDVVISLSAIQRRIGVSRDPEPTLVIPVNRGSVLTPGSDL